MVTLRVPCGYLPFGDEEQEGNKHVARLWKLVSKDGIPENTAPRVHARLLSLAFGSGLALTVLLPVECGGSDAECCLRQVTGSPAASALVSRSRHSWRNQPHVGHPTFRRPVRKPTLAMGEATWERLPGWPPAFQPPQFRPQTCERYPAFGVSTSSSLQMTATPDAT